MYNLAPHVRIPGYEPMMKMRKGDQPLVMIRMEVMTRVIAIAVTVDMMMMTTAPTVRATAVKTMIANMVAMIGVNPLMIEKMNT